MSIASIPSHPSIPSPGSPSAAPLPSWAGPLASPYPALPCLFACVPSTDGRGTVPAQLSTAQHSTAQQKRKGRTGDREARAEIRQGVGGRGKSDVPFWPEYQSLSPSHRACTLRFALAQRAQLWHSALSLKVYYKTRTAPFPHSKRPPFLTSPRPKLLILSLVLYNNRALLPSCPFPIS